MEGLKENQLRDPSYCSLSPSNLEKLCVISGPGRQGGVRPCSPFWRFQSCIALFVSVYMEGREDDMQDLPLPGAIKCSLHFAARKVFVHFPTEDVRAVRFWMEWPCPYLAPEQYWKRNTNLLLSRQKLVPERASMV